MNPNDLERLRQRYSDAGAFSADDPVLREAANAVQRKDGGRRSLPYSGIPTFLGLPQGISNSSLAT